MRSNNPTIDLPYELTPKVSICCTTFNHEEYIEDAINGFLLQETDFEYEILIHDDASQDQTVRILEEYRVKFPEKIQLILQTENKYSKGFKVGKEYLWPKARGEYIALCEGDDYWSDKKKTAEAGRCSRPKLRNQSLCS